MGALLCCMSQPMTQETRAEKFIPGRDHDILLGSSSVQKNIYRKVECSTLEDCLLASPNLNAHPRIVGGEIQIFKHLPKRVYPSSSSPDTNQEFFTPRRSFSGADRLGRIDEDYEEYGDLVHELSSVSSVSRSGSGKVKKKVSFKVPEEADIYIYYTPKDESEEE
ncbi:hypothetical protein ACH5RR_017536 [Cinchona calisaya]|uniref:Uncharacterized protein n=1 Tax=Cinchona calisaya TaxID=153742 RepID=A0ABD2ZIU0_9GENT